MKIKSKTILVFALIVFTISCNSDKKEVSSDGALSDAQESSIDSICQSFIEKGNTIGLSMAIAHEDSIVFSKGYGLANIESKKPASENTIYAIASISKFIAATTTMKMVEQGKLSLDDKVVDYFEDFPSQEFMDEITIEHLLRHQSGLVDHEDWFDSIYINEKRVFTQEEFFDFLDQPLFFRPGTLYSYSNSGYAILSTILEKINSSSFNEVILENIAKPLDLSSLGMWPDNWDDEMATMGYELTENGIDTSFHMMTKGMKGDGGLSASVVDLLKIAAGITSEKLINKSSLDQMLSPSSVGDIFIDYGLGVKFGSYNGQPTWGHSGGYKGIGWAMLAHYPASGFTFAAAMNTSYSPEEVWNLRHLIMPIVLNIETPKMEPSPVKNIDSFTGEYAAMNRWGQEKPSIRIATAQEGNLFWDNPDTPTPGAQLYPTGENTFSWEAYPFDEFKFHVANGKIVACSEYYDGLFGMVRMKQD